jgi:succinyl-CoA synthetase beta subunit
MGPRKAHDEQGKRILQDSGLPITTADNLAEAAERVVQARAAA